MVVLPMTLYLVRLTVSKTLGIALVQTGKTINTETYWTQMGQHRPFKPKNCSGVIPEGFELIHL